MASRFSLVVALCLAATFNMGCAAIDRFTHREMPAADMTDSSAPYMGSDTAPGAEVLPSAQVRQLLLGKWYGSASNEGVNREWLIERAVDGTYRADYLITDADGQQKSQSEVGFWGTSGGVYFRIFRGWAMLDGMRAASPERPEYYDAYNILRLDAQQMDYQHLEDGRRYHVRKMPADFRLPVVLKPAEPQPSNRLVF